ncbi:hypothetical protein GCM10027085_32390 [Spirosoma aerophilum]
MIYKHITILNVNGDEITSKQPAFNGLISRTFLYLFGDDHDRNERTFVLFSGHDKPISPDCARICY